ncbi:MAG TPA: protein-disulfide reductase DsbD domain-containing protein [Caulobacteraceae bacterium]
MKRLCIALLALTFSIIGAGPAGASPTPAAHLTAELVARTDGAAPGTVVWVALVQHIDKGWHTYWRNPGDAGEATRIIWSLPAGWRAGDIVWPAPRRLPVGPIMNYGYEGQVLLSVPITIPAGARIGQSATITALADFLVCADVCVPTQAKVALVVPVVSGQPHADQRWGAAIGRALAEAPKPAGLDARFQAIGKVVKIAVAGAPLAGADAARAYFYPYDDKLIDHAAVQTIDRGPRGLTLTVRPGIAFSQTPAPATVAGVLALGGRAYEIAATPGAAPAGSFDLGPPVSGAASTMSLALAVVFALLGGLILNLMPCVFPILSMKAAALVGHAGDQRRGRTQGLAFMAGVLITFLALAGVLIAAKGAGAAIGWGFQLQSPVVVAALALIMLAAALNLSGLYEIGASVQGLGAGAASRGDLVGSLLTGVLAVVVAAPCTAPFMGPALGWALTQSAASAAAVFLALGLGFAAPFTVLAFTPGLIGRLPKPGAWMDWLKRALAFPMYATAAWLAWVLAQQAGPNGLALLLAAAVSLGLAAWLFGAAQLRRLNGKHAAPIFVAAAIAFAFSLGAILLGSYPRAAPSAASRTRAPGELASVPYSAERLAALRAAGKPVLVNFTAAWCVTCQVNERLAFSSPRVAEAFARTGAIYMVADWTNHDGDIAKALAAEGRIGVPLYLVYGAGAGAPAVLPQILTPAIIAQALRAAVRPAASAGR